MILAHLALVGSCPSGAQAVDRLLIEIRHAATECDKARPVCADPDHWRISMNGSLHSSGQRDDLNDALARDVAPWLDKKFPELKELCTRKAVLSSDGRASYSIVFRVMRACVRAGINVRNLDWEGDRSARIRLSERSVDVRVRIRWENGRLEKRINDGKWLAESKAFAEAVSSAVADDASMDLEISPAPDVPWSEVLAVARVARPGESVRFVGRLDPEPTKGTAPLEAEASAFASAVEKAFDVFDQALDREGMLDRMVSGTLLSLEMHRLVAWVFEIFAPSGKKLMEEGPTSGLKFLKIRMEGVDPRPLFRVFSKQGLDYWELVLKKTPEGKIRIADIRSMLQGGLVSDGLRRHLVPDPISLEILNRLLAPLSGDLMGRPYFELTDLIMKKKYAEALAWFDKNFKAFRSDRRAHVLHMDAARQVDTNAFREAVEKFQTSFPKDASLPLWRLEEHLLANRFDKALGDLEEIERLIGGDPFLGAMHALMCLNLGRLLEARDQAERAAQKEPALDRCWNVLISVCLAQKDWPATARFLTAAVKQANMKFGDLKDNPVFEQFVKTPEYTEWLKSRE